MPDDYRQSLAADSLTGMPRIPPAGLYVVAIAAAGAMSGMIALLAAAYLDTPIALVLAAPFGLAVVAALLYDTRFGLCAIAFTIPLTAIFEIEVIGVTLSLPEVLMFTLVLKEATRAAMRTRSTKARDESHAWLSVVPYKALTFFVAASVVAIGTGLRDGWPARAALQDFRQFTEFVALFLLVVVRVRSVRLVRAMLGALVAGGMLIALHGIVQRFTGFGIPLTQLVNDRVYHEGIRSGSFYGATTLGAFMVLVGSSALGLMLSSRYFVGRAVWLVSLGVCLTAAVYTGTRASWLAFAVCFALAFAFVRKSPFVIAVAVGGGTIVAVALGALIVERMQKLAFTKAERSLLERVQYYTVAWHIFRAHPLFGLGYGCYYDLKSILVNDRYVPVAFKVTAEPATVHSAYLQILVKTGLVGLAAFLSFLAMWLKRVFSAFRARRADAPECDLFVALTAGLIGYLFHAAFENFFQWPMMAQTFWMLLGLSTVLAGWLVDSRAPKAAV